MSLHAPEDYYEQVRDRLADLGIEPVLIGALAANGYRVTPRATTDVDFLARTLDGVIEALEADGYECKAIAQPGSAPYVVFARGHGQRVDILLAETAYQHAAIDRAIDGRLAPEDVIVHKLLAWRSRDQDDIASILTAGHLLDRAYIEHWVQAWGVDKRWAEATRWS